MPEILIVDDELDIGELVSDILTDEGYETKYVNSSSTALAYLEKTKPKAIILDVWLDNSPMDGLGILKFITKKYSDVPVIIISGHGNIETAVQAIKLGAYDFIEKPFKSEKLLITLKRALEVADLKEYNLLLKQKVPQSVLIGTSKTITNIRNQVKSIALSNSRVLITGESGVGKKTLANIIHQLSDLSEKPFITVSVIRHSESELEKLFFGDKANNVPSVFKQATNTTLFFDEVFNLPIKFQNQLLNILQSKMIKNSHSMKTSNCRIIASTSININNESIISKFNRDLYNRLNSKEINIPPLKDRKEDIKPITDYYLSNFSHEYGINTCSFSDEAYSALIAYNWPGNTRQLMNLIERTLIKISDSGLKEIQLDMLPSEILSAVDQEQGELNDTVEKPITSKQLKEAREDFEKKYIQLQLSRFGGNIKKTAEFIGMERAALHRKIKSLGMENE